jgi:hypothetical protein
VSPAEATAAVLRQATAAIPVPIPGAFEQRVGRIRPTAAASESTVSRAPGEMANDPARTYEKPLSRVAHMVGGRLHRLTAEGNPPIVVTYKGAASISLVVLMFLVFSEPRMSAGAIAALVATSVLAAAIVAVVTRGLGKKTAINVKTNYIR